MLGYLYKLLMFSIAVASGFIAGNAPVSERKSAENYNKLTQYIYFLQRQSTFW